MKRDANLSPRILVVDDDADFGELIVATATAMNLTCVSTTNARDFFAALRSEPSLLVIDLVMPQMDGIELLRELGEQHSRARIILMSGVDIQIIKSATKLAESLGLIIAGHLQKPFSISDLEALIRSQLQEPALPVKDPVPLPMKAPAALPVEGPATLPVAVEDAELHQAVENEEFILHYQPQVQIASQTVVGFEALVRWKHPRFGLIFPDSFIPRLQSIGLIDQLGWLVVARGLSEIHQLSDPSMRPPHLSFNMPPSSLQNLEFPDRMLSFAKKFGVPSQNIVIEITESGLMEHLSKTLDVLTRLRMKGFELSIDDFGTGYAMMQQLHLVPASELKIDRSLVQNLHLETKKQVVVRKTIEIGHELGMRLVAEGVETQEEYAFLRSSGCDWVQGYWFCRPLPMVELSRWLLEFRAK
jgi:EAL domain-containing protein (putative c-di-GMP-specific phosphodiesterase class I)/DNA-binding response OmpR family regulator